MAEIDKPKTNYKIIGYNLLVMFVYTILLRLAYRDEGFMVVAFLIALHCVVCFIVGIASLANSSNKTINRLQQWLLSSLLVLLIGFATCWLGLSIK